MDQQAATLLSTLKRPAAPSDSKINQLNALKSDIKHYRVPETAQSTIFECIRLAITQQASATLASTAFSTLGHLLKRLKIQDATGQAIRQLAPKLFPALQERMGDLREPVRNSASQALTELYSIFQTDVEQIVLEEAIGGNNGRAKETGMKWVLTMHNEQAMPFKAYASSIVARLEDADGQVRETAKTVLIELFSNAPDRAKTDLKKQLIAHGVRLSIASQILTALESGSRPQDNDTDMSASTRSLPGADHIAHFAEELKSEAAQPPPPEIVPMDPIYVHTQRELEDVFREMHPHFEGKETEQNWMLRDKSVLKIRRLLKGNAANEFHTVFMAGVKSSIEGILKVSMSLRTTMSSNGCQLVQELAKTLGPALDPHVEILLQAFIKASAATKHIAAENGRITAGSIFQNCSYHVQMMRHIWQAAQEKNAQVRQYAPEWLMIVLKRQASYRNSFENSGGLELAEKCIKKGLDDANPKVKEGNRVAYWVFAKTWPDKAEAIMSKLDPKMKAALEKHPGNPHAVLHASHPAVAQAARPAGTNSRTALREMLEEKRKAKTGGRVPPRPNSAMADISPVKNTRSTPLNGSTRAPSNLSKVTNRTVSTTSNASSTAADPPTATKKGSSLMSGPVRRPRRADPPRPQTADPYSSRRLLRPETPASNASPAGSPGRGTGASKASLATSTTSAVRNRAKVDATAGSPGGSPHKRSPALARGHYQNGTDSRPTSKGSMSSIREDETTITMPKNGVTIGRGAFSPGHKGHSASVDSGLPTLADDEGFTMVIPNLNGSQSRARSPLAYRNPMKAMFEDARERVGKLSPEAQKSMRRALEDGDGSEQQQGGPAKPSTPQTEEVQIYEDPFIEDGTQPGAQDDRQVLGELPINENVRADSPAQSVGSSASPVDSPVNNNDNTSTNSASTPTIPSQDRSDVLRDRRLLASAIERIRTKNLDAHGFRRVQDLARSKLDIWEAGKKFDELMSVLLEYLRTFDSDVKLTSLPASKSSGLKTQALGLVRALLTIYRKHAAPWYAKSLVTVIACRKGVDPNSHVLADMHRTTDAIVSEASSEICVDAVLDALPSLSSIESPPVIAMALTILRQLLLTAKTRDVELSSERRAKMAQATAKYLGDADSEVRKADVELASELFEAFGESKAEFWSEFKGVEEGRLGLLTYYIAKKGKNGVNGVVA
ncbi:unnamed protein product [Zymoseptoria tritici ST99CH_3D7]|uniref:TOG domain-containing protein n=1 Tax=Zymoseptoria tritici (strain ST99CH_3D7) TaxID=1276538 RepID=A0A1X7S4Y7_ZYMT9|nr:unnamed protein product [Zymoseptoria tritici ST99CH_3D7]